MHYHIIDVIFTDTFVYVYPPDVTPDPNVGGGTIIPLTQNNGE